MHTPNTLAIIKRAQLFINKRQEQHLHVTDLHVGEVDAFFDKLEEDGVPRPKGPVTSPFTSDGVGVNTYSSKDVELNLQKKIVKPKTKRIKK